MFSRKATFAKALLLALACCVSPVLSAQGVPYPLNQPLKRPPARASAMEALSADGPSALTPEQQSAMDDIMTTLGRGYNSFLKHTTGNCVNGTVFGPKPATNAPSYNVEIIKSYDQFSSEMSAEASVSGTFSAFSASVKTKFDSASNSQRTRQFLLVRERVLVTPSVNLRDAKLVVSPPDASVPGSAAMFYRRCGDSFVSQIQMGGEFIALLSYDESEEDQKSELEVDASASGWGASASAHLDSKMSSLRKESSLEIQATQIGGKTKVLPDFTLDGLIDYTRNFPGQVEAGAAAPVGLGDPEPYSNLGVDEADFSDTIQAYQAGVAAANLAETRTAQALALLALLHEYSIPGTRTPNDILDRTMTQLAQSQSDATQFHKLLAACATHFWQAQSCAFPDQMRSYRPPRPGPLLIAAIDTRSNAETSVEAPNDSMHLELRGQYCWRGNDNCDHDGIRMGDSKDDAGWILIYPASPIWYTGRPVPVRKGRVTAKAVDTDYGDNGGSLKLILY